VKTTFFQLRDAGLATDSKGRGGGKREGEKWAFSEKPTGRQRGKPLDGLQIENYNFRYRRGKKGRGEKHGSRGNRNGGGFAPVPGSASRGPKGTPGGLLERGNILPIRGRKEGIEVKKKYRRVYRRGGDQAPRSHVSIR